MDTWVYTPVRDEVIVVIVPAAVKLPISNTMSQEL